VLFHGTDGRHAASALGSGGAASYKRRMDLTVTRQGAQWTAEIGGARYRCALGRGGVTAGKREGDGATPLGAWPLRRFHYRPDRLAPPENGMETRPIQEDDGWCDDPADAAYNRLVKLPYAARHERLWRDDHLYDLIGELGYNDAPPLAGAGSAIFLHLARPDYAPTEGCVALARDDLLAAVALLTPDSKVVVKG
jgi:L,D-peptidoglycan transpeptidase YkuD (ErfK/YbiS/YcfS/YnhG family)